MASSVVVAQLGARDHYGYARAFQRCGRLEALITDLWWDADFPLPGAAGRRLRSRWHPELAEVEVHAANLRNLAGEGLAKFRSRGHWERILERNARFQVQAVEALDRIASRTAAPSNPPRTLFAYSYAARDLFRWARQKGWKTVLGQINPGPMEDHLVQQLCERHAGFADPHRQAPHGYYEAWREELELADGVLVNSEWSAEALRQEGVGEEKLRVVPIPYEANEELPEREWPSGFSASRPLRLLFLGQVNLRKGIAELLEAMELLDGRPVELHVVGEAKLSVPERFGRMVSVVWHGSVPRQDTRAFFDQADLFVLPTHSDGFGLTQVEALAAGVPVLTSTHCARVVEDGVNGRVLPEVTPQAIREAVEELLDQPSILAGWASAARLPECCAMDAVAERLGMLAASPRP